MGHFAANVALAYQTGAARGDYSVFSAMDVQEEELFAAFGIAWYRAFRSGGVQRPDEGGQSVQLFGGKQGAFVLGVSGLPAALSAWDRLTLIAVSCRRFN